MLLVLIRYNERYLAPVPVLEEARETFPNTIAPRDFDLVEIPFPERGEPKLVPEGAKQRPEAPVEPAPAD